MYGWEPLSRGVLKRLVNTTLSPFEYSRVFTLDLPIEVVLTYLDTCRAYATSPEEKINLLSRGTLATVLEPSLMNTVYEVVSSTTSPSLAEALGSTRLEQLRNKINEVYDGFGDSNEAEPFLILSLWLEVESTVFIFQTGRPVRVRQYGPRSMTKLFFVSVKGEYFALFTSREVYTELDWTAVRTKPLVVDRSRTDTRLRTTIMTINDPQRRTETETSVYKVCIATLLQLIPAEFQSTELIDWIKAKLRSSPSPYTHFDDILRSMDPLNYATAGNTLLEVAGFPQTPLPQRHQATRQAQFASTRIQQPPGDRDE